MISEFIPVVEGIRSLVPEWETRLSGLDAAVISEGRNGQGRTIRQITGHMVDSASNNLHRIVHLQYGPDPLHFPNYASGGNNDRWIAIQNFQNEEWSLLVELWKYSNLHIAHVIENIDPQPTPELTNIGSFEKAWRLIDGQCRLRKKQQNMVK